MTFAFVSTLEGAAWGGSEELWALTACQLARDGHRVVASVAGHPGERPHVRNLERVGVVVRARPGGTRPLPVRLWERLARWPAATVTDAVLRWLEGFAPDLVCISHGGALGGYEWMVEALQRGFKYVVVSQANTPSRWATDQIIEALRAGYRGARRVYCVAVRNRELLEDQLGIPLTNAAQVRNPFNLDVGAGPLRWPSTAEGFRLACVARLDPAAKGQDLLFHALAQSQWLKRPVEVDLYGQGLAEASVRSLAARLCPQRVRFCGHVRDIEGVWKTHHLLVLPSRYEGLPLALVEAALCGRPAVVTDVDGNTEVTEEGVTGYVAPAATREFVAAALERAWESRERWPTLGLAARERALRLFPGDPVRTFADELVRVAREL